MPVCEGCTAEPTANPETREGRRRPATTAEAGSAAEAASGASGPRRPLHRGSGWTRAAGVARRAARLIAAPFVQTCSVEGFERRAAAEGGRQVFQAIVGQSVQVQATAEDGREEQDGEESFQGSTPRVGRTTIELSFRIAGEHFTLTINSCNQHIWARGGSSPGSPVTVSARSRARIAATGAWLKRPDLRVQRGA